MKKDIKLLIESVFGSNSDVDLLGTKHEYDMTDKVVDYVDLGLPTGTLWCRYNVGANKETDYGNYYQWGETKGNVFEFIEKYHNVDGLTLLLPEDDIAYQTSNGLYRMPTEAQCAELVNNTDNEFVENFNGSGVNGYVFRSKVNNNYIFIPAAGHYNGNSILLQGSHGSVWSSCRSEDDFDKANIMFFHSSDIRGSRFIAPRHFRICVRGVLNKK